MLYECPIRLHVIRKFEILLYNILIYIDILRHEISIRQHAWLTFVLRDTPLCDISRLFGETGAFIIWGVVYDGISVSKTGICDAL